MGPYEVRTIPESLNLGCLHIFGLCFALGGPFRGPFNATATWRDCLFTNQSARMEKPGKLVCLNIFEIFFSLLGPFIRNTTWRGWLFRNRNANMSLGEERNLPESSNLVGLHISGLFLFQVSSRRKRQTSQGVKEKKHKIEITLLFVIEGWWPAWLICGKGWLAIGSG